jgi:hypothetical protein
MYVDEHSYASTRFSLHKYALKMPTKKPTSFDFKP